MSAIKKKKLSFVKVGKMETDNEVIDILEKIERILETQTQRK